MPLVSIKNVLPDVQMGVWNIDESEDVFLEQYPELIYLKPKVDGYASVIRRLEVLAEHVLIRIMLGGGVRLGHEESGRPYLSNGYNIGISHTRGCAVVVISRTRRVAADVEYMSDRVERVIGRILRDDEEAGTLLLKLLHWCTKETLYKLYPEDTLASSEVQLLSIDGDDGNGVITARNVKRDELTDVRYLTFDGYVLTYAAL